MSYKRHISLFLLLLISLKTLVVPFIYLDFELRKEYIIHNLCENRFKTQLHCDGKCYLAKQLHKVAEGHARDEAQKQSDSAKRVIQEVFEESQFNLILATVSYHESDLFSVFSSSVQKGFLSKPVMPPIA
ncbi:hypothetical protein [Runella sp.]|uniref:hypothetical protein n=1 Tax=Runella sp. TaxID=1960881 RepID=UPI003D10A1A0